MSPQCTVRTGTLAGVQVLPVDVEVDVGAGLPSFAIVGLPDLAVQEARERVRSALRAQGFDVPNSRIVVNLAPGPVKKHGTGFDLPIAIALLAATGQIPRGLVNGDITVGELSLNGTVRQVPGMLAYALAARSEHRALVGPSVAGFATALPGLVFHGIGCLAELRGGLRAASSQRMPETSTFTSDVDFADVMGQDVAIRALVAAASGGHNVLLIGPPGSGKTMLARRLPTILESLEDDERLQTALIHSVSGLNEQAAMSGTRPFRSPHHSASIAGLIGGGNPPRPGEASLAHNGVLFLDEMPQFGPAALQCLRQPLEDGSVTLVRAEGRLEFPARFTLVGAANPCPCGYLGDPGRTCTCSAPIVERYRTRIGGPLMDRIDLVCHVWRPDPALLLGDARGVRSSDLATHVRAARERARSRGLGPTSRLSGSALLAACSMRRETISDFERIARVQHLSGRGVTRLLRVSRTFADLEGAERVCQHHLTEAVAYRAPAGG